MYIARSGLTLVRGECDVMGDEYHTTGIDNATLRLRHGTARTDSIQYVVQHPIPGTILSATIAIQYKYVVLLTSI